MTLPIVCQAAGCLNAAADYATRDGEIVWAACTEHLKWLRPFVKEHDREMSVAAATLWHEIRAKLDWRLGLASVELDEQVRDEICFDVLNGLFGPLMVRLVKMYAEEMTEERIHAGNG